MIISGNIYFKGSMIKGNFDTSSMELTEKTGIKGTLIPMPVNTHTHIGDSFIMDEPAGTLPEIVGPGGLKHRALESADEYKVKEYMEKSERYMENTGTLAFFDFRENGINGINLLKNTRRKYIVPLIFGRPYKNDDPNDIIKISDGIGLSSVSDIDYDTALKISELAHKNKKIMALHFSENTREDINMVLGLKPDLLIHGIEASDDDLDKISGRNIYLSITPRSNIFYGKRPDYSKFLRHKIKLMLGTDNVFTSIPDIFMEMDFLYRYQRFNGYISPEDILRMVIDNPREFMLKKGIKIAEKYIFFRNELLNPYQIVTKRHYHEAILLNNE
ncbi:amidohydrolase family protein [Picrophilus oshimae]|uniref:N-ethylammeline chlorohydrolase n=1 Tax=Picrophilus torridus (strain ATCC 700027 / DSM 9790 / JCM 10055 / NBRC 100828 / KAW 2/3) TaxID=1122961 RepID=Q6L156_PICTO|nr:amidohydrolase family protein [Picrophilus oshimae]AAT43296.1 N-ethylammeline chlorohydrolase [Picrophilus oshimae DSM 9789]